MKAMIAMVAVVAALVTAGTASASSRHYVDELALSNSIESHGFPYGGRRLAVDSAFCEGLRRFGVRSSEFGLDRYWRFKCEVSAANGHMYELQVRTTTAGIGLISAHKEF